MQRGPAPENLVDLPALRDRTGVFRDRAEAGRVLAGLLDAERAAGALLLAIPAGGTPVAAAVARQLGLALDVAVVSKMTPPMSTEVGYGAVAWDGTVRVNEPLAAQLGLSRAAVDEGIARARQKVARRVRLLRGSADPPLLAGRDVVLIDDGLASGFTMQVAVEAARNAGAARITVAVPTAHVEAARRLAGRTDRVAVANLRSGLSFAVADAYLRWRDVPEEELVELLARGRSG
jgi:predicted phosphoribosyltransferase